MIYTVTFNPALDYVVHVDALKLDAVNRSHDEAVYYGGKGINVSTVLKNLGIESIALGFVAGFTGKEIEEGVKKIGVKTDFIHLKEGMSRINVKIKGQEETEINAQGPYVSDDELAQLYAQMNHIKDGDVLILAGTIPATLPSNIYETIMANLRDKKVDIIVDATKELLLNVLKYKPFLIKPNNHELGELFNKVLNTDEELIEHAKKLQHLGARNVIVSMAGDGAILVTETNEIYKMGTAQGIVRNSVGAGDSMVAGFLASYLKNHDYLESLKWGTAAGGATAFSEGLARKEEIEEAYYRL